MQKVDMRKYRARDANGRFLPSDHPKQKAVKRHIEARQTLSELQGRFAVAQTNSDNARHWAAADHKSADAAYDAGVRKIIRERARLEVENNTYAKGMISTLANDIVGPRPKLQVLTPNAKLNERIEHMWEKWSKRIKLGQKLRTAYNSYITDGEVFILFTTKKGKLNIELIESDRVTDPGSTYTTLLGEPNDIDGVILDSDGDPKMYKILKYHPGDYYGTTIEYDDVGADFVIHMYRQDRPEQHRGISQIASALPLFADLRRYTLAVIAAAETAAEWAAVIKSDVLPEDVAQLEPMDIVQLERRMATVLPQGWDVNQLKAEQPTQQYGDFKRNIVAEIARCLNMPYNTAAGDSSGHNFSSAKLDGRMYMAEVAIRQADLEEHLDRIFIEFLKEVGAEDAQIEALIDEIEFRWMFVVPETREPKEITADIQKLQNGLLTLEDYYAKKGQDWEVQLDQIAREKAKIEVLGLKFGERDREDRHNSEESNDEPNEQNQTNNQNQAVDEE